MSEADTLFAALRQSSGDDAVAMLERMMRCPGPCPEQDVLS
jgi:hypothetical protein